MIKIILLFMLFLLSCQNDDPDKLWLESTNHIDKREYLLAIPKLKKVIEINADFDSAFINLAYCYMYLEPRKGLELINETIEKFPDNLKAVYIRSLIYKELGEYFYSLDDIERASYDFNLQNNSTLYEKIDLLIKMKRINDAIDVISDLLETNDLDYKAITWLATAHRYKDISESIFKKIEDYDESEKLKYLQNKYFYTVFSVSANVNDDDNNTKSNNGIFDYKYVLNILNKSININKKYAYNYYMKADIFKDILMFDS